MTQLSFKAVVMAAGLGTRMKSELPKVMHPIRGLPMIAYPVDLALSAGADEVAVVVGYGRELVERFLTERYGDRVSCHVQAEMRGTADAVRSAWAAYAEYDGAVMILSGDVPNLSPGDATALVSLHATRRSPVTMLTAHDLTPNQYGRIVRDSVGEALRIVEHKDATEAERAITEVNIGTYLVDADFLRAGLMSVDADNAAGEFYLTDLVETASDRGTPCGIIVGEDIEALHGVNDRRHLARAERYARRRANDALMASGVTMIDPDTVYIDAGCVVGHDVTLEPSVRLVGSTVVGAGAVIEAGCRLRDAVVAGGARVLANTVAIGSRLD